MEEYLAFWNGRKRESNFISHSDNMETNERIAVASGFKSYAAMVKDIKSGNNPKIVIPTFVKNGLPFYTKLKSDNIVLYSDNEILTAKEK